MAYTTRELVAQGLSGVKPEDIPEEWIEIAGAYIDEYCNHHFGYVENYSEKIEVMTTTDYVIVSHYPVHSIKEVRVNNSPVNINNIEYLSYGKVKLNCVLYEGDIVDVTYDYGYREVPEIVTDVATEIVKLMYREKETFRDNLLIFEKSQKFVNFSVTYDVIESIVGKVFPLKEKLLLIKRNYT